MKYYFKATMEGGKSKYDPAFVYHEGINTHPNPDKSNVVCGNGIHLAVTIEDALYYASQAKEFYLARPIGKIYGRDDTKIRVGKCRLWRIPDELVKAYDEAEAIAMKAYAEAIATAWKAMIREQYMKEAK